MTTENLNTKSLLVIFVCWTVATIASLGSLFFSEVMQFQPCVLCWYQRITMYPLVILFLVGAFSSAQTCFRYTAPFVALGFLIATYHNLLHYGVIPESASPCVQGVPCSTVYINYFGFITIPILSLLAFSLLAIGLYTLRRTYRAKK